MSTQMSKKRHGLSIGIERIDNHFFISLKAVGTLTHDDYTIITPLIDSALNSVKEPVVNMFIDATAFEGWELRAAWDDLKLGLKHDKEIVKMALVGNKKWQEYIAKIGEWFMSGEMKYFEDPNEALTWLNQ